MPRKRKEPQRALCCECGISFETAHNARFCKPEHRIAFAKRLAVRGAILAPYVLAEKMLRHAVAGSEEAEALAKVAREVTQISRIFLDEDKAAIPPRPPISVYALSVLSETRYIDRERRTKA